MSPAETAKVFAHSLQSESQIIGWATSEFTAEERQAAMHDAGILLRNGHQMSLDELRTVARILKLHEITRGAGRRNKLKQDRCIMTEPTNGNGNGMALARVEKAELMTADEVVNRMTSVQDLVKRAMRKDQDYGVIPGTNDKQVLLKPGAEKLCTMYRLAPTYKITQADLGKGHREYMVVCTLTHITDGNVWGEGMGSCSTMESKYRWRRAERKCPLCGKAAIIKGKEEFGGGWLCWKKKDGCGATFTDADARISGQEAGRVENPDVADTYNTVLKMATKRALVAAVLITTGASALFTQDIDEDLPVDDHHAAPAPQSPPETPAATKRPKAAATSGNGRPKAAAPAAAPAVEPAAPAASPEEKEFTDTIIEVREIPKKTPDQKWQMFRIVTTEGSDIPTFSSTIAAKARQAMTEAVPVRVVWTNKGKGDVITDILPVEENAPVDAEVV